MASYTERQLLKEEILPNQTIQLRVETVTSKDGVDIGSQYHRTVYHPGEDVSEAPAEVQAIAAALWTDEVIAAYQASLPPAE